MTVDDGKGPNKFEPAIRQDGKDVKVDLEGSMPEINEALVEETLGNVDDRGQEDDVQQTNDKKGAKDDKDQKEGGAETERKEETNVK